MRRWSLSVAVLALGLASVGVVSQPPKRRRYRLPRARRPGDLAALYLDALHDRPEPVQRKRPAATDATMSGGTTPNSAATASNLGAAPTSSASPGIQYRDRAARPDRPHRRATCRRVVGGPVRPRATEQLDPGPHRGRFAALPPEA